MIQLWARAIRRNRIVQSETMPMSDDLMETIGELFKRMDLPTPLFLGKHEREWAQFGLTSFARDHFVEPIPFDRVEIEQFDTEAEKKQSRDPRNG